MKKKIVKGLFGVLILITAIVFVVSAISSYNYDMDPANGVDIMEGMPAAFLIIIGGFVILCELDLFFTVYYFLVKPKTLLKLICITKSSCLLFCIYYIYIFCINFQRSERLAALFVEAVEKFQTLQT